MAPDDRRRVAEDRRELLLLLADASVRLAARPGTPPSRPCGCSTRPSPSPDFPTPARSGWTVPRYWSLRGDDARSAEANRRAENTPATTARDHYLIAASLARQGGPESLRAAIAELDEALRLNPRHFWSLVQRGICQLERGELVEAAGDFGQSTGLWPEFAWGYFNRGCVLDRAGDKAAAILDYSAALERDPGLVPAHVNRGLARLELPAGCPGAGGLRPGHAPWARGRGRLRRARRRPGAAGPARGGRCRLRRRMRSGRRPARRRPGAAGPVRRLRRRRPRPRAGPGGLRRGAAARPAQCPALYGLGMLAMTRGEDGPALRHFDRALEADPGRVEARRYRAILLARRGDWKGATREINGCLGASRGRRRRCTRPRASCRGPTRPAARARPPRRRSTSSRGPRPREPTSRGPPMTPTSPRSEDCRDSVAWSGARRHLRPTIRPH